VLKHTGSSPVVSYQSNTRAEHAEKSSTGGKSGNGKDQFSPEFGIEDVNMRV
jgi:hypothetical protein